MPADNTITENQTDWLEVDILQLMRPSNWFEKSGKWLSTFLKCADCGAAFYHQQVIRKGRPRSLCDVCRRDVERRNGRSRGWHIKTPKVVSIPCRKTVRYKVCPYCGTFMERKYGRLPKYCSRLCAWKANSEHPELIVAPLTGTLRVCAVCGCQFEPYLRKQKCCSKKCQMEMSGRGLAGSHKPNISRVCERCGSEYLASRANHTRVKYCDDCKHHLYTYNGARNRADKFGVAYEVIVNRRVFDRDGWICGICHERVDKRFKYPNPQSASLDHIVPISLGGAHAYDNVQCSHLGCNCRKYNGASISQLHLGLVP